MYPMPNDATAVEADFATLGAIPDPDAAQRLAAERKAVAWNAR